LDYVIGMSRDTVMDAVKALVAAGYLTVRGTKGGSAGNTNQFEFHLKTGGSPATGGEDAVSLFGFHSLVELT
jgi:DNA-binding FadR family transcriptional regulator